MTRLTVVVVGDAAVQTVWERYALLAHWSSWAPQIRAVDADGDRLRPGLRGTVHGPGLRVLFQVGTVDEATRTWTWVVRPDLPVLRRVMVTMEHRVIQLPSGTRADLVVDAPPGVGLAYSPAARAALRRLTSLDTGRLITR